MSRLSLKQPIYQIFGANTGVGKTIISTLLAKAFAPRIDYIKPVSTGPLDDADYLHVDRYAGVKGKVIYQFDEPCSPHLAAGDAPPPDSVILSKLMDLLSDERPTLVETAGGVHSPAPSGSSQLELYRPLRLPVVLVADSNLGGISTTVSAYESLRLHGYDVAAIIGFKADWGNLPYLAQKLGTTTLQIPPPPPKQRDPAEDAENMQVYYDLVSESGALTSLKHHMIDTHEHRVQRLREMPGKALHTLWYPFTQHGLLEREKVNVMDSAYGDDFACLDAEKQGLRPVFDASASWWTQGLGHGNSELALEAAYAGSRYGHVMLPNAVNEPALALAEQLLATVGQGWASRVYYSDNGTTGIEIALKMALKASRARYNQTSREPRLKVIGIKGSYHGDTIGSMNASDPNVYNDQVDWYDARGVYFDAPAVLLRKGEYEIELDGQVIEKLSSMTEVFDLDKRLAGQTATHYRQIIDKTLREAVERGDRFGALIFESILMGAGGMHFVDPLFQRVLVDYVRGSELFCPPGSSSSGGPTWTGLPVITDEVFVGLYRLGHARATTLLGINPDISVNAKLLTGGLVPLAVTLATEQIFNVFLTDKKQDCLLHGHSYTAHPVGTSVALASVHRLRTIHEERGISDQEIEESSQPVQDARRTASASKADWSSDLPVWSVWSRDYVRQLSHHDKVDWVVCMGSVLAVALHPLAGEAGGYASAASAQVVEALRLGNDQDGGVMARPLGNVVYLMAGQTTTRDTADRVQRLLENALQ
ncbi:hypothetical protein PYCC9005_005395 [Savitreella phatthalungensis]